MLTKKEMMKLRQEEKNEQMRQKIIQLIADDYIINEMAEELHVSTATISTRMKEIDETLINEAKQKALVKKQEKILKFIRKGYLVSEVAKEFNNSERVIYRIMESVDKKVIDAAKEEGKIIRKKQEEIRMLKNSGYSTKEISERLNVSTVTVNKRNREYEERLRNQIIKKLEIGTIRKEDVELYKKQIDYDRMSYQDIVLLVKLYINTNQVNKALEFINGIINDENMQYFGIEKLNKIKQEIQKIQKEQKVRGLQQTSEKVNGNEDIIMEQELCV